MNIIVKKCAMYIWPFKVTGENMLYFVCLFDLAWWFIKSYSMLLCFVFLNSSNICNNWMPQPNGIAIKVELDREGARRNSIWIENGTITCSRVDWAMKLHTFNWIYALRESEKYINNNKRTCTLDFFFIHSFILIRLARVVRRHTF